MSEYKQCRINFNCDDSNEMIAYEKFKSLGRKATEYVVDLILADLSGKTKEPLVSQVNISNEVIERLNKIETRLSVLENNNTSVNKDAEIEISSKMEKNNSVPQTDPNPTSTQDIEEDDNSNSIPTIPADIAARLGGF